jgi:hypothetical protein
VQRPCKGCKSRPPLTPPSPAPPEQTTGLQALKPTVVQHTKPTRKHGGCRRGEGGHSRLPSLPRSPSAHCTVCLRHVCLLCSVTLLGRAQTHFRLLWCQSVTSTPLPPAADPASPCQHCRCWLLILPCPSLPQGCCYSEPVDPAMERFKRASNYKQKSQSGSRQP